MKAGGIDYFAVLSSRMKGWRTRTFLDRICVHRREMGTAQHSVLQARYNYGAKDYAFGNHPVWETVQVSIPNDKTSYRDRRRCAAVGVHFSGM